MAKEIVMPQMGAEMEEGTIIRWTKQVGDRISRGETIGEIETDKATVDLESFDEGYFLGAVVPDGTAVPVGTVIGYLGEQGEALPASAGGAPSAGAQAAPTPAAASATRPAQDGAAMPSQQGEQAARPVGQPAAGSTDAAPAGEDQDEGAAPPPPAPSGEGAPARQAQPVAAGPRPAGGSANGRQPAPVGEDGQRLRVSPVARAMAAELGVDLTALEGSGPDGRIMRRDVEEAAKAQPARVAPQAPAAAAPQVEAATGAPAQPAMPVAAPATAREPAAAPMEAKAPAAPVPTGALEPLSKMRQTIARRMAAAKREIPHYYLTMSVDMGEALAFRRQLNTSLTEETKISVNDLIVKACALALEQHPRFNTSFTEEGLRQNPSINIGIAVALDDGLVVPAVLNCQGKSLGAIAREARDVAERARGGRMRPAELTDGTFTVSNLGMYGVETLIAIIQPGQSAILGVGKVEQRPVARDGEVAVREMLTIALSADHRVSDGAQGARFLATIRDILEHPGRLVL